jgi:hypothetical protein
MGGPEDPAAVQLWFSTGKLLVIRRAQLPQLGNIYAANKLQHTRDNEKSVGCIDIVSAASVGCVGLWVVLGGQRSARSEQLCHLCRREKCFARYGCCLPYEECHLHHEATVLVRPEYVACYYKADLRSERLTYHRDPSHRSLGPLHA